MQSAGTLAPHAVSYTNNINNNNTHLTAGARLGPAPGRSSPAGFHSHGHGLHRPPALSDTEDDDQDDNDDQDDDHDDKVYSDRISPDHNQQNLQQSQSQPLTQELQEQKPLNLAGFAESIQRYSLQDVVAKMDSLTTDNAAGTQEEDSVHQSFDQSTSNQQQPQQPSALSKGPSKIRPRNRVRIHSPTASVISRMSNASEDSAGVAQPSSSGSLSTSIISRKKKVVVPMASDEDDDQDDRALNEQDDVDGEDDDEEEDDDDDDEDDDEEDDVDSDGSDFAPKLKRGMTKSRARKLEAAKSPNPKDNNAPVVPKIPSKYNGPSGSSSASPTLAVLRPRANSNLVLPQQHQKKDSVSGFDSDLPISGSFASELSFDNIFGPGQSLLNTNTSGSNNNLTNSTSNSAHSSSSNLALGGGGSGNNSKTASLTSSPRLKSTPGHAINGPGRSPLGPRPASTLSTNNLGHSSPRLGPITPSALAVASPQGLPIAGSSPGLRPTSGFAMSSSPLLLQASLQPPQRYSLMSDAGAGTGSIQQQHLLLQQQQQQQAQLAQLQMLQQQQQQLLLQQPMLGYGYSTSPGTPGTMTALGSGYLPYVPSTPMMNASQMMMGHYQSPTGAIGQQQDAVAAATLAVYQQQQQEMMAILQQQQLQIAAMQQQQLQNQIQAQQPHSAVAGWLPQQQALYQQSLSLMPGAAAGLDTSNPTMNLIGATPTHHVDPTFAYMTGGSGANTPPTAALTHSGGMSPNAMHRAINSAAPRVSSSPNMAPVSLNGLLKDNKVSASPGSNRNSFTPRPSANRSRASSMTLPASQAQQQQQQPRLADLIQQEQERMKLSTDGELTSSDPLATFPSGYSTLEFQRPQHQRTSSNLSLNLSSMPLPMPGSPMMRPTSMTSQSNSVPSSPSNRSSLMHMANRQSATGSIGSLDGGSFGLGIQQQQQQQQQQQHYSSLHETNTINHVPLINKIPSPLIQVQSKPPPPQMGLVGAISAMEREKKAARLSQLPAPSAAAYQQQLQQQQLLHQQQQLQQQPVSSPYMYQQPYQPPPPSTVGYNQHQPQYLHSQHQQWGSGSSVSLTQEDEDEDNRPLA